jgi:hypothetical protein
LLVLSLSALSQPMPSMVPQTIEFPSGKLRLKAYLRKPACPGSFPAVLFNHGSGGDDADHTAGMPITQAANVLAPFFVKHGVRVSVSISSWTGSIGQPSAIHTVAVQIAHGLAPAHDKGIVHRVHKPENLFITKDGRVEGSRLWLGQSRRAPGCFGR